MIASLTFNTKHSGLPAYLSDDLHDYQPAMTLQSSTTLLLQQPQCFTSSAAHSFTITAPDIWNSLFVQTDPLTALKLLNVDWKQSCSSTLTPPRTFQWHHVLYDLLRYRYFLSVKNCCHPVLTCCLADFRLFCHILLCVLKSSKLPFHAGGLSDRGYNSMSSEDARRIATVISCTDSADRRADVTTEDASDLQGIVCHGFTSHWDKAA